MEQQQHEADAEPQAPSCLPGFFDSPVGDALALARQTPGLVLVVSLQGTPLLPPLPRAVVWHSLLLPGNPCTHVGCASAESRRS